MDNKQKFIIIGVFVFVTLLVGTAAFISYDKYRPLSSKSVESLTEEEKKEILAQIESTNNYRYITNNGVVEQELSDSISSSTDQALSLPRRIPENDGNNYNFFADLVTTTQGPAAATCEIFDQDPLTAPKTIEYHSFNTKDQSYTKSISRNSNNDILHYYLFQHEDTQITDYTYFGGSYALETKTIVDYDFKQGDLPVDYDDQYFEGIDEISEEELVDERLAVQIDEENIPDEYLEDYTDNPEELIGEETINGINTYIVESSYDTNCDITDDLNYPLTETTFEDVPTIPFGDTIISRNWVNKETYEIVRTEEYLGTVTPENLLISTEIDLQRSNESITNISPIFEFDQPVEIKTVEFDYSPEGERQKQIDFLTSRSIQTLRPDAAGIDAEYLYLGVYEEDFEVYSDRAFYPQGELGDVLFKQNSFDFEDNGWIQELSNVDFSNRSDYNSSSYFVSMYSKDDTTLEKVIEYTTGTASNDQFQDITIKIDNNNYPATMFTDKIEFGDEPDFVEEPFIGRDPEIIESEESVAGPGSSETETKPLLSIEEEPYPIEEFIFRSIFVEVGSSIFAINIDGPKLETQTSYAFELIDSSSVEGKKFFLDLIDKSNNDYGYTDDFVEEPVAF